MRRDHFLYEVLTSLSDVDALRFQASKVAVSTELRERGFCESEDLEHWMTGGNMPSLQSDRRELASYCLYKLILNSMRASEDRCLVDVVGDHFEVLRRSYLGEIGIEGFSSALALHPNLFATSNEPALKALRSYRSYWLDPQSNPFHHEEAVSELRRTWSSLPNNSLLEFIFNEAALRFAFRSTSILTATDSNGGPSKTAAGAFSEFAKPLLGVGVIYFSWIYSVTGFRATLVVQPF